MTPSRSCAARTSRSASSVRPTEGASTWFCGYVNLKDAPGNEDKAYDYINAWLDDGTAKALLENFGYATTKTAGMATISAEELQAASVDPVTTTLLAQTPLDPAMRDRMVNEFERSNPASDRPTHPQTPGASPPGVFLSGCRSPYPRGGHHPRPSRRFSAIPVCRAASSRYRLLRVTPRLCATSCHWPWFGGSGPTFGQPGIQPLSPPFASFDHCQVQARGLQAMRQLTRPTCASPALTF